MTLDEGQGQGQGQGDLHASKWQLGCEVERRKEAMIQRSASRREPVVCSGCGSFVPLMNLRKHEVGALFVRQGSALSLSLSLSVCVCVCVCVCVNEGVLRVLLVSLF